MLATIIGAAAQAPRPRPDPPSIGTPNPAKYNRQALSDFADGMQNRMVPPAADGLPLWDKNIFSDPSADEPENLPPLQRQRRGSLRPQYELLSTYTPLGNTDVGRALRDYGNILWNIRQHTAPRLGLARQIREEGVARLGGIGTAQGAEFMRRCRITSQFVMRLSQLRKQMLAQFPQMHSHFVREETDHLRTIGLYSLSNGRHYGEATPAKLRRAVECRVQRSETNWLTFPIYWAWSKLWC